MKVLIAYEGSECSDAAIVDLPRAGLPAAGVTVVLSVAETSPQLAAAPYGALVSGPGMYVPQSVDEALAGGHHLEDAQNFAEQAANRLRADFPGWHITTEAWVDSAALIGHPLADVIAPHSALFSLAEAVWRSGGSIAEYDAVLEGPRLAARSNRRRLTWAIGNDPHDARQRLMRRTASC